MVKRYLSDIYVYPIKSLSGVRLNNTKVMEKGLQHDRRWMLVDESGNFMTIRKFTEFLFFKVEIKKDGYNISYKGESLTIPHEIYTGHRINTKVWGSDVEAIVGQQEWHDWFSDLLGVRCILVHMPETATRRIKTQWGDSTVSFADGYPYLVAGKESLNELNNRLENPIEMERFRPNLVFEGGEPYEEFRWSGFSIGSNKFQGLKPCERCVVTTYDLKTGERGREPLLTLSRQKINEKIVFGQHVRAVDQGMITLRDEIVIDRYKDSPYDPL